MSDTRPCAPPVLPRCVGDEDSASGPTGSGPPARPLRQRLHRVNPSRQARVADWLVGFGHPRVDVAHLCLDQIGVMSAEFSRWNVPMYSTAHAASIISVITARSGMVTVRTCPGSNSCCASSSKPRYRTKPDHEPRRWRHSRRRHRFGLLPVTKADLADQRLVAGRRLGVDRNIRTGATCSRSAILCSMRVASSPAAAMPGGVSWNLGAIT